MKIHLIGIGGIGVSALAQYYLSKGYKVSGSDLVASEITDFLKKKGIKIYIGNDSNNIKKGIDLVVYSPAVKTDNSEYKKSKQLKIKTISYPEALGELTKEYYTIAVAGAHGKSTTTAMIGLLMVKAKLNPTVIIGTKVKEFGNTNFRKGKGRFLVIEACEYDSSFLHYLPHITVITNVDKEHLDYFKNFNNVKKAFKNFILRTPKDGYVIFNKDDKNIPRIKNSEFRKKEYSKNQKEFQIIKNILEIPGQHNVYNALAALNVARIFGVPDIVSLKSLADFNGTWRRFEIKKSIINKKHITLISDYAHHPNEISATLKATREKYQKQKVWCIFQPHQHQRTHYLFKDFVKMFRLMPTDKIIITDIYDVAGRETKSKSRGVTSEKLVNTIKRDNIIYLPVDKIEKFVKENISNNSVLVVMGAGDIYKLYDKF